jgi:DNA-binding MarR family transcriptional regulator
MARQPTPQPVDGPAALGDATLELIHQVMHRVRAQQFQVLRDGQVDITHMESKVLGYLQQHPGATQSDLARDSGRDKAQLARLIKGLRDKSLLTAEPDADDRRNLRLQLTPEGQAALTVLRQQSGRLAAQAVAGLSAEEGRLLHGLLQRVNRNLGNPDKPGGA